MSYNVNYRRSAMFYMGFHRAQCLDRCCIFCIHSFIHSVINTHKALAHVVARHGLSLHQYADDCQVYTSSPVVGAPAAVDQLSTCLVDVEAWLKTSGLRLNPGKTQVMWLGSQQLLSRLDIADVSVLSFRIPVQETTRDLGVVIDSRLTLSEKVAAVC